MTGWNFDNSYARLPARMFHRQPPAQVPAPRLLKVNAALAHRLGLDPAEITADIAAGNAVPPGADPLAQAYAGHQFGNLVPQLGDGRALLLGEQIAPDGARFDLQLKGSGRTPFSRGGDGKAWLGPVLREYLMSETMHALGLPTTRALAMATTGEQVLRERPLPGAVLMRVAASHIRVGTFQFFALRGDTEALAALTEYAINRHAPEASGPEDLLEHVVQAQADLIAGWMAFGFIHGVMNTDNCTISGETIDYGPCAFMESYHPMQVFSSIDRQGRYAYGNQPAIAAWNLAQLGSSLLPLMPDSDAAIPRFQSLIDSFFDRFSTAWLARFAAKLGLPDATPDDVPLIEDLLALMAEERLDFTQTFASLTDPDSLPGPQGAQWRDRWRKRTIGHDPAPQMAQANPTMVPRLHQIESAITAAVTDDFAPFETLLAAATTPFAPRKASDPLTQAAPAGKEVTRTFCGT
ncbi:MAG: hypothetical protein CSA72_08650 [Rhodobacterales bacterium]|nr:MAG: hypothetical protein CSA72_08650 [Rhodobacterales bacterium]